MKLLLKLWPALTPIAVYLLWRMLRRGKAAQEKLSPLESRLWIGTLILSLVIAIVCIVAMGVSAESGKEGTYVRPQYENHHVIPGHVEEK